MLSGSDPVSSFSEAIAAAGLPRPDAMVADGKRHRYKGPDDKGKDGFYLLHLDGVPAGAFGHWRLHPEVIYWHAERPEAISREQRARFAKEIAEAKASRDAEEAAKHTAAAKRAQEEWQHAKKADPDHPYLCRKLIGTHGIKETADGRLIVPVYIDGKIVSLQYIDGEGSKLFLKHGKASGGYYRLGGEPNDLICVAEGFATAATIREAGDGSAPVFAAFSASNLPKVAQSLRKKYPRAKIVIAADNDLQTEGNPGVKWAKEAVAAVKGQVIIPRLKAAPDTKCDWNDVAKAEGLASVRTALDAARGLLGTRASDIEVKPLKWEWLDKIPRGEVTIFDGDPGTGKSLLSICLAACKSTGRSYPDGSPCELGNVILTSAEDSESTIIARLQAHDADLSRIRIVPSCFEETNGESQVVLQVVTLPDHVKMLEEVIRADRAHLFIVDPLSAFVNERVDSHKDASIRRVMAALTRLAQATDCAIVLIRHLTKQIALDNALYRGSGSIGIIGAARASFLIARDPTDKDPKPRVVFAHAKANLGPKTSSLAFRITVAEGDSVAHIEWIEGECKLTANDLLTTAPRGRNAEALQQATEFLQLELADGRRLVREIEELAKEKGISLSALKRARLKLGVRAEPIIKGGAWWMFMPDKQATREL